MEFKDIKVNSVEGRNITERYSATIGEVTRARVGLLFVENEMLRTHLPLAVSVIEDSFITREHAEAVVAGNLALIRNVDAGYSRGQLAAAGITVETGLAALERGSIEANALYNLDQANTRG